MKNRLQFLRDNVDQTNSWLAMQMGVSEEMVVAMREQNDLNKRDYFSLSESEEEKLRAMYPTASWQALYDEFPRFSKAMLKERAYSLGLKRETSNNQYSEAV